MKKNIAKQLRQRKRKIRNRLDKRTMPQHLGPMLNPGNIHYEIADRNHVMLYGGMTPAEVVGDANNRCNLENLIEQLKNGVRAMRMPVDDLVSNWAYMVMASLAWNLKAWFALLLPAKGRWHKKHKTEKTSVLRMEFKKFRTFFIMLPSQIVKTGRKLVYRLLGWNEYLDVFFRAVRAFGRPLRC